MNIEITIGRNIREARKNKQWSQSNLSAATGISNTTISAYETGKKEPGLVTLLFRSGFWCGKSMEVVSD